MLIIQRWRLEILAEVVHESRANSSMMSIIPNRMALCLMSSIDILLRRVLILSYVMIRWWVNRTDE